jgi:hypothetical protein
MNAEHMFQLHRFVVKTRDKSITRAVDITFISKISRYEEETKRN